MTVKLAGPKVFIIYGGSTVERLICLESFVKVYIHNTLPPE